MKEASDRLYTSQAEWRVAVQRELLQKELPVQAPTPLIMDLFAVVGQPDPQSQWHGGYKACDCLYV